MVLDSNSGINLLSFRFHALLGLVILLSGAATLAPFLGLYNFLDSYVTSDEKYYDLLIKLNVWLLFSIILILFNRYFGRKFASTYIVLAKKYGTKLRWGNRKAAAVKWFRLYQNRTGFFFQGVGATDISLGAITSLILVLGILTGLLWVLQI